MKFQKTSISPVNVCDLKHSRDEIYDVTDLEELHKERHQSRFTLAWNWPHNLCISTSWPLYFMNKYRETMQYPNGKCLECLNHTKGKCSISLSQCHKPIVKPKYII